MKELNVCALDSNTINKYKDKVHDLKNIVVSCFVYLVLNNLYQSNFPCHSNGGVCGPFCAVNF